MDQRYGTNVTKFSVYKVSEGGLGQKQAIQMLKDAGIKARPCHSPYVGQTGVEILTVNKRIVRKAERILFGD